MSVLIKGLKMPKKWESVTITIFGPGGWVECFDYERHGEAVEVPTAQPERLTDDDFETIRIHLNAYKEKLCNQRRWKEAEEYQRIIDRFMASAHAQPTVDIEPVRHAKNVGTDYDEVDQFVCSECGIELQDWCRVERDEDDGEETYHEYRIRYCPNCGARVVEEDAEPKEEPDVSKV